MTTSSQIGRWIFAVGALLTAVILVYAQTLGFGMVSVDDPKYLLAPNVASGVGWENFKWAFSTMYFANDHPLMWLSLQLDATLFGDWRGGAHLVNVLIHLANSLLITRVLYVSTGCFWRSLTVAVIFAVHPTHVESVAWLSERKDVLSLFFGLLAVLAYIRYARVPSIPRFMLVAVLFALSLLSKPMLVTLPAALLLLDFWPLRRMAGRESQASLEPGGAVLLPAVRVSRLVLEKLPLVAMSLAASAAAVYSQNLGGALVNTDNQPLTIRIAYAITTYVRYLGKTFWPWPLSPFYHDPTPLWWQVAGAAVLLLVVTAWASGQWRKRPYLIVGWLWFLGTLVPVIGLVQVGGQTMADRYTYMPHVGLFAAIVWLAADIVRERQWGQRVATTLVLCLVAALALVAHRQVAFWRDGETLWAHAVEVAPADATSQTNYGIELTTKGEHQRAITHLLAAVKAAPLYYEGRYALAIAYEKVGNLAEAISNMEVCVQVRPRATQPHAFLGDRLMQTGDYRRAAEHLNAIAELEPGNPVAAYNVGVAMVRAGAARLGVAQFERALRLRPTFTEAHVQAGAALEALGDLPAAKVHYAAALVAQPENAAAHNGMGIVLAKQGDLDGAIREFIIATRLAPGYADARDNLARARSLQSKPN